MRPEDLIGVDEGVNEMDTVPVAETINWVLDMEDNMKAAFFSFIAAMLCRCGLKSEDSMDKHWKSIPEKFCGFYGAENRVGDFPNMYPPAYKSLKVSFAPGSRHIRTVLSRFLKARYTLEDVPQQVKGVLDFTLLLHTSFNGMQMIPLTIGAAQIMGQENMQTVLRDFEAAATKSSIIMIFDFLDTYAPGSIYAPGHFAPWCRVLDPEFWSGLSAGKHGVLATLLMAICEEKNPQIFQMLALKADVQIIERAKVIANRWREERAATSLTVGARQGSLLARYGAEVANLRVVEPEFGDPIEDLLAE